MNRTLIFSALFLFGILFFVKAQDTQTMLINRINTLLSEGNCEGAQRLYDDMKYVTGKTNSSVESRIRSCRGGSTTVRTGTGTGTKRNGAVYNPDGIQLVYVEGSGTIKDFYIGKFEVTQAQWQKIMGNNPSHFKGTTLPVESVSWNDVKEFLGRLNSVSGRNYRLPTSAEWEFAARGGTAEKFCPGGCEYSGSNNINNVAWYEDNSGGRTQPVGTKLANELGIHDMSGNVLEWCEDAIGTLRVIRGGCWQCDASWCLVAYNNYTGLNLRNILLGFRLVLSL